MKELVFKLCSSMGVSGSEKKVAQIAADEFSKYTDIRIDKNNNVIASFGNTVSKKHIMLDAHIDQIGLVVTYITEDGFLKVAPCGGVDSRVLPGSVLKIHGKKDILGIVTSMPPHLSGGDNSVQKISDLYVDTGMPNGKIKEVVKVGDVLSYYLEPKELLNSRVSCCSLDNRAGVASLIRCAQILSKKKLDCRVSIVLSSQEETNAKGAKTAAYILDPDEAIMVDVSFADQPDISSDKSGTLGKGPMIGIAPSLSRDISNKLIKLSEDFHIPYQIEVMGGKTGTNADKVSISREGILGGLVSIPQRYMHTPCEIVALDDIENTARLLALYVQNGGL